jgi:hypothetical protein
MPGTPESWAGGTPHPRGRRPRWPRFSSPPGGDHGHGHHALAVPIPMPRATSRARAGTPCPPSGAPSSSHHCRRAVLPTSVRAWLHLGPVPDRAGRRWPCPFLSRDLTGTCAAGASPCVRSADTGAHRDRGARGAGPSSSCSAGAAPRAWCSWSSAFPVLTTVTLKGHF